MATTDPDALEGGGDFLTLIGDLDTRTRGLESSAGRFARAMASAFTSGIDGGRRLEDVLRSLALRLSDLTLSAALRPLASALTGSLDQVFAGLLGNGGGASVTAALGAIKPFAAGGVIATPTYFPLRDGGAGLAGEAGPEAILPLARGPDGRLGVAASDGGGARVTINIATPDADSFRRSEAYLTGQIARAVARGQRSL